MPRGLFELRKDAITGWWVAVVVDREFNRERFAKPAIHLDQPPERCPNCSAPGGDGVRVRMLKQDAFIMAGTEREREAADGDGREPVLGLVGDAGSYQTIVAPPGHHESFAETTPAIAFELLARTRDILTEARIADKTDYLQVVQNYGTQAGALTDHLCFDFYDIPQIPHRVGEELGGAARYVIREGICPFCRLVRDEVAEPTRLVYEDSSSVAFAPYASRSPFELWVVPRHHAADFGTATDAQLVSAAETLQSVLKLLGHARRPGLQPRPAHRSVARARRRDLPLALGDSPAPPRDRRPRARNGPAGKPRFARGGRARAPRHGASGGYRDGRGERAALVGRVPADRGQRAVTSQSGPASRHITLEGATAPARSHTPAVRPHPEQVYRECSKLSLNPLRTSP